MKKLIVLCVLVAFAGFAVAELYITPVVNADFESGMSGWSSWGSGSGSGPSGYAWKSHWAYIETTGGSDGGQFMAATTASQVGYSEYWGWGYDVIWRGGTAELLNWSSTPGVGSVTMGAWLKDLNGTGAIAELMFEWIDWSFGDGGGGGGGTIPRQGVQQFTVTTDWAYYSATLAVPTSGNGNNPLSLGAYGMRPVWGVANAGKLLGIDQVSAVYVPEPMSIALLGFGALALRRRK